MVKSQVMVIAKGKLHLEKQQKVKHPNQGGSGNKYDTEVGIG